MADEERGQKEMWKIGGENEMNPFEEEQKPITSCSSSGWNLNLAGVVSSGENLFHGSSMFGSSELGWSMDRGAEQQERSGSGGQGFSDLMDIDVGFDSSYLSFTQCLQAGMNMDSSYYNSSSKTLGIMGRDQQFSDQYTTIAGMPLVEGGDVPNVPTTPNSSTSLSSGEGNDDVSAAASSSGAAKDQATVATQADQAPVAASVADQEESQDKLSADSKKLNKPRKKGQKRNREPRFAFMTKSDVDNLEDGYRWRKYGQKAVKNSPYPRSYYRCTNAKCSVKKRVERSFEDPSIVITTYEGQHTHQSPALLRSSGGGAGTVGGGVVVSDHGHFPDPRTGNTSSFTQSHFDFPSLQMMVQVPPRTTITTTSSTFELIQQHQQTVMPSPHPALQRSHQNQGAHNLPDHGLLEDIVPSGMRKLP